MTGSGFLHGAHPQEQRREIFDLHNKAVSFGGRVKLDSTVNLALGGIFRHYLDADMRMLERNYAEEALALAKTRHDLLVLRRNLIEDANKKCAETLLKMLEEYGSEAVHYHLNIQECNKAISDAHEFINEAEEDAPVELYRVMLRSGETEDKVADNLKKLRAAHPLIEAGAKTAAPAAEIKQKSGLKRALVHTIVTTIVGALIAGLIKTLLF